MNVIAQSTFSAANVQTSALRNSAGAVDLNTLSNVTASRIVGNYNASTAANFGISETGSWSAATNTTWGRYNIAISSSFVSDPLIKVGTKVAYTAGWRLFASATATTPLTAAVSPVAYWTPVDSAVVLTVSGVAAAIAALAF